MMKAHALIVTLFAVVAVAAIAVTLTPVAPAIAAGSSGTSRNVLITQFGIARETTSSPALTPSPVT